MICIFLLSIILFIFDLWCILGYCIHRCSDSKLTWLINKAMNMINKYYNLYSICLLVAIILTGFNNCTSVSTAKSFLSGEAKQYYEEIQNRNSILEASKSEIVYITPLKNKPSDLFVCDLDTDYNNWKNRAIAKWYNIEKVGA